MRSKTKAARRVRQARQARVMVVRATVSAGLRLSRKMVKHRGRVPLKRLTTLGAQAEVNLIARQRAVFARLPFGWCESVICGNARRGRNEPHGERFDVQGYRQAPQAFADLAALRSPKGAEV